MKIYIDGIIYSLQKGGGITRYTDELINGFNKSGHEVILLIHEKTCNESLRNKNIKTINIKSPLRTHNKIIRLLTYPIHKWKTNKYLKKVDSGVFHSTYFTYYRNLKIPQVLTIHDLTREKFPELFNNINNKIFLNITNKSIQNTDKIICVSKETANDLIKYYKVKKEKVAVTHLGVNKSFITKTDKEKISFIKEKNIEKPYILFVGRRSGYKNFDKFIEAFSTWSSKNDFLIITVGGGKMTEDEIKLIEKFNLKNKITSYDFVSEEELVMFYNCAHSFIFPSLSEGFGLPLLEAMSCSTTLLASDIPVFYEVAEDIPYYFNPEDIDSIKKVMDQSKIKDKNRINNGLEFVKKYNWENTTKETLKIYNELSN